MRVGLSLTENIEAIVLNKENRAENYLSFTLFSKDLGICYAMIKVSRNKNNPLPDFFNEISVECNKGNFGNNYFIKSINSIESLNNFHKNYKGLLECTKLAQCLIRNASHLEDFSPAYKDFVLALKAYITATDPRLVNIKWLYKFARNEGYPIKEDFAQNLSAQYQEIFVQIINTPSSQCNIAKEDIGFIYDKLSHWLNYNTDIIYS